MNSSAPVRSPRPPARPNPLWRNLALVFGASTIALSVLLVRVSDALETLSARAAPGASLQPADAGKIPPDLLPFAALGSLVAEENRLGDTGWSPAQLDAFVTGLRLARAGQSVPMNESAQRLRDEIERPAPKPTPAE